MMLAAYIDESGHKNDRTILCLGCLVSTVEQWSRLEVEWRDTLLASPIPKDGEGNPKPFHMTDFESRRGDFSNRIWSERERREVIQRLTGIMTRRVKHRAWTAVSLQDYRAVMPDDRKLRDAYALCGIGVVSRVAHWARKTSIDFNIPYIFEKAKGVDQGRAKQAIDDLANSDQDNSLRIGTTSTSNKALAQLQAADIWAYEVRKYLHGQLADGRHWSSTRASLERLLDIPDLKGFFLRAGDIEKIYTSARPAVPVRELPILPISLSRSERVSVGYYALPNE